MHHPSRFLLFADHFQEELRRRMPAKSLRGLFCKCQVLTLLQLESDQLELFFHLDLAKLLTHLYLDLIILGERSAN